MRGIEWIKVVYLAFVVNNAFYKRGHGVIGNFMVGYYRRHFNNAKLWSSVTSRWGTKE